MTLTEILEEHSVKAISQRTMISEENIENIVSEKFSTLAKAKTFGFISILERDFNIDLTTLKEKALVYYDTHTEEDSVNIALPRVEEKKGRSKWFPLLMLGLLAYASWYFFTQFDKKTLGTILPFTEDKVEMIVPENIDVSIEKEEKKVDEEESKAEEALSISTALTSIQEEKIDKQSNVVVSAKINEHVEVAKRVDVVSAEVNNNTLASVETIAVETVVPKEIEVIALMPENKLWFGLVDMSTGKRRHTSISGKYEIDVKEKSWLVATSPAPFSFINQNVTQEFNDARAHYFKVSRAGIEALSKSEYVSRGGYRKW